MKYKRTIIVKLIPTLLIILFLIRAFFINDGLIKLAMIPFLICAIASFIKDIFLMNDNYQYVSLFQKIYTLSFFSFVFGFLSFWSYLCIRDENYGTLLFSIPFWIISLLFAKRSLFSQTIKKKSSTQKKQSHPFFNAQTIVFSFLIGITLLIGVVVLSLGMKEGYDTFITTNAYESVDGYFVDYVIDNSKTDDISYRLIYAYQVNGKEYQVITSSGSDFIPEFGTTRTIKYNPQNPKQAIIIGQSNAVIMIVIGLMFTLVPTIILLAALQSKGIIKKIKTNYLTLLSGFIFIVVSFGALYIMTGSFSIINMFKTFSLSYLIPCCILVLMIVVGVYLVITSLFPNRSKYENHK